MTDGTVTLYWCWPERQRRGPDSSYVDDYVRAADLAGFSFRYLTVDDIDMVGGSAGARVYAHGEPIDPERVAFHNKLYTWPMFQPDLWRYLSTFDALQRAGYCTLVDNRLNITTNDKLSTALFLAAEAGPALPTMRIPTRELRALRVPLTEVGIDYPVAVKPSSWGSGRGIVRAGNEGQLLAALGLASAAELTMVVQPWLADADQLADVRVMCCDRTATAAFARIGSAQRVVANVSAGGRAEEVELTAELRTRAERIARRVDAPWLGVDFLFDGETYYFSEVEIEAQIPPGAVFQHVLEARFRAYRTDFDRWLAAR